MRAGSLLVLAAIAALALAPAADGMTRKRLIDRSATICANADRAMQPYDDRANAAAQRRDWDAFVRWARKGISTGQPYIRRLAALDPPRRGREHYVDFISYTKTFVGWLDAMVDAIAARRSEEVVDRRGRKASRFRSRAQRAARAYPLRRACVRMLAEN